MMSGEIIEKVVEMENGNSVKFTAGPRYPYWRVSFDKGGMPAELSGLYTDFDKAYAAVKFYLEHRAAKNRTTLVEKKVERDPKTGRMKSVEVEVEV